MDCDLLTMDVGTCTDKAFKGFAQKGWWTPLSNVDPSSIVETDAGVEFALISGQFYEIYDGSKMPFADTMPVTTFTGKHGFAQHTDKVAFPLKELSPNSAELIKSLASGIPIVVILEQTDGGTGRFPVYGLFGGLHGSPEMTYELNDERCWEVILEQFNTGEYPQRFLFDTNEAGTLALFTLLTGYEYITGLTIGDGTSTEKAIAIEIDQSKDFYIVLPNGAIETSISSAISYGWTGAAGAIILIIPKTNEQILFTGSEVIGIVSSNYATIIDVASVADITGINSPEVTSISAANCAITTANANVIFLNADANGEADGSIDVGTQSTALSYDDLSTAAKAAITALIADGWTIVIDDLPT